MDKQKDLLYKFGRFVLDVRKNRLLRDGEVLPLRRKSYEILVLLVQNSGEMVHKDYLISTVWAGTQVEENNLTQQIYRLRQVLGDTPKDQNFILTVPGKGYIFNQEVLIEDIDDPEIDTADESNLTFDQPDSNKDTDITITPPPPIRAIQPGTMIALAVSFGIISVTLIGYLLYKVYFDPSSARKSPVASFIPFTTMAGIESYPKFSPDGKFIAFTSEGQSGYDIDIYIKQVNQGDIIRVTSNPDEDTHPVWSPDGRQLAILRKPRGDNEKFKLILIPAFGGQEQEIAEVEGGLDWSPDGRYIAVSSGDDAASPSGIKLISIDGSEKRTISNPPAMEWIYDTTPVFSPDSRYVAFVRWNSEATSDLFVVNLSNGQVKQLTFDGKRIPSVRWNRDGKKIFFVSNRLGIHRLWQISITGGEPTLISSVPVDIKQFDISPDGVTLVYNQSLNDTSIIIDSIGIDSVNRPKAPCIINASRADESPQFSPDGKQLVFTSSRSGWEELWLSNADCTEIKQLTTFQEIGLGSPAWSPDGTKIAFDRHRSDQAQIYIVSTDGKTVVELTNHTEGGFMPAWSADGKWIYYTRHQKGQNQIWKTLADPAPGSAAIQVTVDQGRNAFESADSRFLYYTKADRLWYKDLISGKESIIDELGKICIGRYWHLSTDSIYFAGEDSNTPLVINRFDLNKKNIREVYRIDGFRSKWTPGISVTPDRKLLAVSYITYKLGDITLIENWR